MKVTLKDGSSKEYSQAMSIIDIAKDISEGLASAAAAAVTRCQFLLVALRIV